ncbi:unnamed protein product [Clonostachys chloroleuca]|uniref:JmjC domain-containing protein n=1 Tax=Clonostachys chloroleuca TaxID=1926264 RepID=A0AA35LRY0_9HYPO|nr:unnamed protein product [Clonostachys chloroleuca]
MGDMPTKDVINVQGREGMKTKVSGAEFIPGGIGEAPLPGTMPNSNQKRRIKSQPITAGKVIIDLTKDDGDNGNGNGSTSGSGPAATSPTESSPTARNTDKEPCGTPTEKLKSKGKPIGQGTSNHNNNNRRKSADPARPQGIKKPRKSAKSKSLGSSVQAHAAQQASPPRVTARTEVVNLSMQPEELKEFPRVLARVAETDARAQGVFKITLPVDRRSTGRITTWRPKSYLEYSSKALGNGLSHVELRYTKKPSRIIAHNGRFDESPSVLKLVKRQEDRLASSSLSGLRYRVGVPIRSDDERRGMGLPSESPIHPLDGNRLAQTPRCIDGIHNPRCYETDMVEGTPFVMTLEECNLYLVHHLHVGRRVWICISPGAREQFEARMRKEIARMRGEEAETLRCGQFARHARLYFSRSLLEDWGIDHTIVDQKAGEVVVLLPGTYHQGFTLGYTKAVAVNYADGNWAPSKLPWCDSNCPEHPIDPQDMHFDVVDAKVPEASIDRRGVTGRADDSQPRNEMGQHPAIATNLGRSLTPYGRELVQAFNYNKSNLDDIRKARVLQLILQCEWPYPDDITRGSDDAARKARLFASIASVKTVRRRMGELKSRVDAPLERKRAYQLALQEVAETHSCSADDFEKLINQGVVLEKMVDALGMHILLTLPIREVKAINFALFPSDDLQQALLRSPIKASR